MMVLGPKHVGAFLMFEYVNFINFIYVQRLV